MPNVLASCMPKLIELALLSNWSRFLPLQSFGDDAVVPMRGESMSVFFLWLLDFSSDDDERLLRSSRR